MSRHLFIKTFTKVKCSALIPKSAQAMLQGGWDVLVKRPLLFKTPGRSCGISCK